MANQLIDSSLASNNSIGVARTLGSSVNTDRYGIVSALGSVHDQGVYGGFTSGNGFSTINSGGVSGVDQVLAIVNKNIGDPRKMGAVVQGANLVEPIDFSEGATKLNFTRDIHGQIISDSDGSVKSGTALDNYTAASTSGADNESYPGYNASGTLEYRLGKNTNALKFHV